MQTIGVTLPGGQVLQEHPWYREIMFKFGSEDTV